MEQVIWTQNIDSCYKTLLLLPFAMMRPPLLKAGANDDTSSRHNDGAIINKGAAATTEILLLPLKTENTPSARLPSGGLLNSNNKNAHIRTPNENFAAVISS